MGFELEILTKWYSLLGLSAVLYFVLNSIHYFYLQKRLGASDAQYTRTDGVFGFKVWIDLKRRKEAGELVQFNAARFYQLPDPTAKTLRIYILGKEMYNTKDPENIKAMLATQFTDYGLGLRREQFFPLLGNGIFTLDGAGWKHSRAMLRPQFAREQIGHVKLLEPHYQLFAQHIKKHKGQFFDIQELFFRLTVDYATEFLFDQSVGSLDDGTIETKHAKTIAFDGKEEFATAFDFSRNYLSLRALMQKFYFLFNSKQFQDEALKVHKFADTYVKYALDLSPDELEEKSKDSYVFLYEMVKHTRDPKVIRDQLLNILLAGRDTTAGTLSFALLELARRPEIMEKLKEEVQEKFGRGEGSRLEEITFESLKKCEYLKAVVNEALRMYPSVPQNFRVAVKDTTLPRGGGPNGDKPVMIRKGQSTVYSIYSAHRDTESYGKDAEEFRPERWFEERVKKLGWAYLPFNGGPRVCLGQQFALTEISYIIVRMVQDFSHFTGDTSFEYPPKLATDLTLCAIGGVNVSIY